MDSKKQKKNHVVIVTSDAADASVKQYRIRSWVIWLIVGIACIVIGIGVGYFINEKRIWNAANRKIDECKAEVQDMKGQITAKEEEMATQLSDFEAERSSYEKEIEELNNKLSIMSDTVHQKNEEIAQLQDVYDAMYSPTMLPLTGGATIEEVSEGDPMCLFNAMEGSLVIATASGTVTEIVEETEYGYKVTIDHGNGYVSIYRNEDTPKVKQGDVVQQGATIYVVDVDNLEIGYQIMQDGVYINPMDMMRIEG